MTKSRYIILPLLLALCLAACGQGGEESQEPITVEFAIDEGRSAAKRLVHQEFEDSMQLQLALLEAKAKQSRYLIAGDTVAAQAFDTAFVSLLRCVKPELATILER